MHFGPAALLLVRSSDRSGIQRRTNFKLQWTLKLNWTTTIRMRSVAAQATGKRPADRSPATYPLPDENVKSGVIYLLLLVVVLSLSNGCGEKRTEDVEAIKKAYVGFGMAMIEKDYDAATNYLSSHLLMLYSDHKKMLDDLFWTIVRPDEEIRDGATVRFERKDNSDAFLFPHEPPTVAHGFIRETNGWRITADVIPVVKD